METIYLDNGATTKMDAAVAKAMDDLDNYGNASSQHHKGKEARKALEAARKVIADSLHAKESEIVFTSGGTEANNFALKGIAFANEGKHIIVSKIEHDSVLESTKWLEHQGFSVSYVPVDKEGFVHPEDLEKEIREDTVLVSIIHGNNEIGTIQDLRALYAVCKEKGVYFHTDVCQSYMKTALAAEDADLITLNAHKIHGPKGVGALYIRKGITITPLLHGGGHELGLRSGTENIPGIVGFAKAVSLADNGKMAELRDYFIAGLLKIPHTTLNGPTGDKRLCNNINVSFGNKEGESIAASLDEKGICASTGSACSTNIMGVSPVMMAIDNNKKRAQVIKEEGISVRKCLQTDEKLVKNTTPTFLVEPEDLGKVVEAITRKFLPEYIA